MVMVFTHPDRCLHELRATFFFAVAMQTVQVSDRSLAKSVNLASTERLELCKSQTVYPSWHRSRGKSCSATQQVSGVQLQLHFFLIECPTFCQSVGKINQVYNQRSEEQRKQCLESEFSSSTVCCSSDTIHDHKHFHEKVGNRSRGLHSSPMALLCMTQSTAPGPIQACCFRPTSLTDHQISFITSGTGI